MQISHVLKFSRFVSRFAEPEIIVILAYFLAKSCISAGYFLFALIWHNLMLKNSKWKVGEISFYVHIIIFP